MRFIIASIIALLISSGASANDEGMEKYRNWLPSQIQSMPKDQRESEVPMAYTVAANTANSSLGDLTIQSFLNTLMYDGLHDFDSAKRLFQSDLGDVPTGNLTVSQISTLNYRAGRTRLAQVNFFPFQFGGKAFSDWAYVKGTAKLLDEKIAYPVNFVEIECRRSEGICDYRQFVLVLPDEKSWAQSYSVMETVDETYRITRWDKDRIDASPMKEGECRVSELRLNFATSEYYEIVTNAPEGNCEMPLGGTFPKLERPRIAQIVDGDPIVREQFQKISQETYQFLSSEFRAKVASVSSRQ